MKEGKWLNIEETIITHLTDDEILDTYGYQAHTLTKDLRRLHGELKKKEEIVLITVQPDIEKDEEKDVISVSIGSWVLIAKDGEYRKTCVSKTMKQRRPKPCEDIYLKIEEMQGIIVKELEKLRESIEKIPQSSNSIWEDEEWEWKEQP